jgi:hypothetical protein
MKAWQFDDARPVPKLLLGDVEIPVPDRGEVLIQVHAAGVTHTEMLWFPTTHTNLYRLGVVDDAVGYGLFGNAFVKTVRSRTIDVIKLSRKGAERPIQTAGR